VNVLENALTRFHPREGKRFQNVPFCIYATTNKNDVSIPVRGKDSKIHCSSTQKGATICERFHPREGKRFQNMKMGIFYLLSLMVSIPVRGKDSKSQSLPKTGNELPQFPSP